MPNIQRVGDANSAGGVIAQGISTVRINGRAVAVSGMPVSAHGPCGKKGGGDHCASQTRGGSSTVRVANRSVILSTDTDTCGHGRSGGSDTVRIGR
jgi:uncharacterized Zn-binding protein involved in type VI secretion